MILTGDLILESAKRGISFPSNNANNLDDEDILAFAYEEMITKVIPLVTSIRQEFLIAPLYTINIVSGTQRYRIPQRALARTLRNVIYIDSGGNRREIAMVMPEDAPKYMNTTDSDGPVEVFYVENDYLVMLPVPSEDDCSLEITYPLRPSQIVKLNNSGVISTATASTSTIVLTSALSTITTSTALDIISSTSGNIVKTISITPTNVSSATLTFAADAFGDDVIPGDYICLAEQSPVAQIPEEAHVVIARATQNRILESIDDYEGLKEGKEILKDNLKDLAALLTPRVEGKSSVVLGAANRFFVRSGRRGYFPKVRV